MSWEWILYFVALVVLCTWAGPRYLLYQKNYFDRVAKSKKISETPNIKIPKEISLLVGRFDPSIEFRIADDFNAIPSAAIFHRHPTCIVISRYSLGELADDNTHFETKYLCAIVAHELGHIMLANQSTWLLELCSCAMADAFVLFVFSIVGHNWLGIICSILAFILCANARNKVSRSDEYRADAFAVVKGSISVADLVEALKLLEFHTHNLYKASKNPLGFLKRICNRILGNGHPSLDERIRRLQTLAGK